MKILGIETATDLCGVALVEEGRVLASETVRHPRAHSEVLPDCVRRVTEAGSPEGVAVSIGPGSFTGLRIGLGLAKGLALGWNIPLAGVPTMVGAVQRLRPEPSRACVLITARKDECYLGCFAREDDVWKQREETRIVPIQTIGELLPHGPKYITGDGAGRYRDVLILLDTEATIPEHPEADAAGIAMAGEKKLLRGGDEIEALAPEYHNPYKGVA